MVLSDRFGGKRPARGLLARTLIYVLGFGLGSLAIAALLGFVSVSVAESLLPTGKDKPAATSKPATAKAGPPAEEEALDEDAEPAASAPTPKSPRGIRPSKARPPRGNQPSPTEKEL